MSFTHAPHYQGKAGLHLRRPGTQKRRAYYRPEQRARILERARKNTGSADAPPKNDASPLGRLLAALLGLVVDLAGGGKNTR